MKHTLVRGLAAGRAPFDGLGAVGTRDRTVARAIWTLPRMNVSCR